MDRTYQGSALSVVLHWLWLFVLSVFGIIPLFISCNSQTASGVVLTTPFGDSVILRTGLFLLAFYCGILFMEAITETQLYRYKKPFIPDKIVSLLRTISGTGVVLTFLVWHAVAFISGNQDDPIQAVLLLCLGFCAFILCVGACCIRINDLRRKEKQRHP